MNFVSRRHFVLGMALLCIAGAPVSAQTAADAPRWIASWAAAAQHYGAAAPNAAAAAPVLLSDISWRQQFRPSLGGGVVRLRFSNLFGGQELHIAAASIGEDAEGANVEPGSLRAVRFDGRASVTIAPGAEAWSDPLRFEVDPRRPLAVSFRLDRPTQVSTVHQSPPAASWSLPGDAVMQPRWTDAAPSAWNQILTGLDVQAGQRPARVLVAFGDSITEGAAATDDHGKPVRYPDLLAQRLDTAHARDPRRVPEFAVINAGISGNRLLVDWVGPRGLDRFERDVLGQSGVSHVLIMIGVNDIGLSLPAGAASPVRGSPSARELVAGLQRLIAQAKARGVTVLLGTLLPFEGAFYWSEEKERRRAALNDWIRNMQNLVGVVDFDLALRDPERPRALRPIYDSGDHLHPGNAGYAAMAEAVDLRLLAR